MPNKHFSTAGAARNERTADIGKNLHDRRLERARRLDFVADAELSFGRHAAAERLSRQAAELREGAR